MNTADTFTFVIASPRLWEGVAISAFHEALRLLSRVLRGTALLAMTGAIGRSVEELGYDHREIQSAYYSTVAAVGAQVVGRAVPAIVAAKAATAHGPRPSPGIPRSALGRYQFI